MTSEKQNSRLSSKTPLLGGRYGYTTFNAETSDEFSFLPPVEATILRNQVQVPPVKTSFFSAYRYASKLDLLSIWFAVFCAAAEGSIKAIMPIMFGAFAQQFTDYIRSYQFYDVFGGYDEFVWLNQTMFSNTTYTNSELINSEPHSFYYSGISYNYTDIPEYISPDEFQSQASYNAIYFIYLAVAEFIFAFIFTYTFIDRSEVFTARIREKYLGSILKQNIAYFDKLGTGEITTRISSDTMMIQEGISEKLGYLISFISTFVCSFVIGYSLSPKLAGFLTIVALVIVGSFIFASYRMTSLYKKALNGSSAGGSIIEEVLSSIRNVQAFSLQDRLSNKYDYYLRVSMKYALQAGFYAGSITGISWLGLYLEDAVAFWQGAKLLQDSQITIAALVTILASMIQGLFAITSITPHVRAVSAAASAINKIYTTIDRTSSIDSSSDKGSMLSSISGHIELKDLKFIYPSRPDVIIMQDYNLKIEAGTTVALVGASGSGKSTIIGLLERFYRPVRGQVFLDGHDLEDLNVKWLRQQISLVSQEPILFAGTVYENVAFGLLGTKLEHASDIEKHALVREACIQANAMSFIDTLPKGIDTHVGERGFLLSGGQKQRIAIARAVVSNPKVLLLDEATSALDTKSEGIVQNALERASKNRTTIVIAHRLSTVKNADKIVVMKKGVILEQGTHDDLIKKKGEYYGLVQAQNVEQSVEISSDEGIEVLDGVEVDTIEQGLDEKPELMVTDSAQDMDDNISYGSYSKESEKSFLYKTITGKSDLSLIVSGAEEDYKTYSVSERLAFLWELSLPEKKLNLAALSFTIIMAAGYPYLSTVYSGSVDALGELPDAEAMNRRLLKYNITYLIMGAIEFICPIMAVGLFSYSGQRLVRRIRMRTLKQIVRQDIGFFDKTENTAGALTFAVSKDAQAIEGLSGATLGQIFSSLIMLFGGIGVALGVAIKLAAVTSPCIPLLLVSGFYRFYLLAKHQEKVKAAYSATSTYACEAAASIKTVAALRKEDDVLTKYSESLSTLYQQSRRQNASSAALYGLAQGLVYLIQSLMFWYGSTLVRAEGYSVFMFFVSVISIVNGSQNGSIVFSYALDMAKAYDSAGNLKRLFDREPIVDAWSDEGNVLQDVQGNIEFRNVTFRYPTRLQVPVLRGLNLKVEKGQYIALVGSSGCGKSTTIGLIERFYNTLSGEILLDGIDISTLNINNYRSNIALVQQEPVLYSGTVRDNVKYGTTDLSIPDEKMYEVCKQANIHDFIMSLPDGYDTMCGAKGSLFSGGQKQRIAIARALIRDPKILLLDEATSALDNDSEKIVQAALDNAAKGRTTIAIAHRLSTIQKADIIYVFENGKVLESGSHQKLLANKSKYYELVQLQALEST
ncbi:P-loop containing nucleoside triphosphate hydrolase protein [Lipomyces japonicus]|uniref:P-loop containing nucleoside triphosphate hydrolase protein n=1 Tax=Lipomyces japonicus TaxID=56871 RepID=UPI0034CE3A33